MNTVVKIQPKDIGDISFQEASFDIWDKKYRLTAKDGSPIDNSMDDTYKRVARALADVESEENREQWYDSFLWAFVTVRFLRAASPRMPARSSTSRPPRRSIAPCPAPS